MRNYTEFPNDRRKESVPVPPDQERRLSERVSILEIQVDNHATKLEENQEMLIKFFDRFDNHLENQTSQNRVLETTLVKVSTVVDNLTQEISRTNTTMGEFTDKVNLTSKKVAQWDTVSKTLVKVATVAALLISAGWAVYTFAVEHAPTVQVVK